MKRTIYTSIAFACALLVSGCGGGGDDGAPAPKSDVVNYVPCGNLPNYAAELGPYLLRWRHFPLTVFIDYSGAPNVSEVTTREMYTRAVQTGVVAWTGAGYGIGAVSLVNSPDADIIVRFGDADAAAMSLGFPSNNGLLGFTVVKRDGNFPNSYIAKGTTIVLDAVHLGNLMTVPSYNPEYLVGNATMHEMGHALFAGGHPATLGTVMSTPVTSGKFSLTQLDINSIREAYCKPL